MAEEKSKRRKQKPPVSDPTEAVSQADGSSVPSASGPPGRVQITDYLVGHGPSTMDTFGEVGHPSGKGTLEIDEQQVSSKPIPDAHPRVDEKGKKTGGKAA